MNLGTLIDESVSSATLDWLTSLAVNPIICRAAIKFPNGNVRLRNFTNQLLTGQVDIVVFLTAGGLERFVIRCAESVSRERIIGALNDIKTVSVGPLVSGRLRELGIEPSAEIRGASSWRDVLVQLDEICPLSHATIGLESTSNIHGLCAGLEARGAIVLWIESLEFEKSDPSADEQDLLDAIEDGRLETLLLGSPLCAVRFAHLLQRRDSPILRKNYQRLIILALDADTAEVLTDRGVVVDMVLQRKN
jgi:uroporphyrinogen-III synthase